MTASSFVDLQLTEPLLRAIHACEYRDPTPIQAQAIPHLLAGRDLLGIAQTGTGKTAAFALPILQELDSDWNRPESRRPRALVLTPTRELAAQIANSFQDYGEHTRTRCALVFGGVSQRHQVQALREGVDILVATPGRLLDLLGQGHVKLDAVGIFVLDEADRMLDMGFIHDVRRIVAELPRDRQSLLFSATMPPDIVRLAQKILHRPQRVEVTPSATPVERISQRVLLVERGDKRALLELILQDLTIDCCLVFARTRHGADRIARYLCKRRVDAESIHGDKSQAARERALDGFRSGEVRVLVATDIAARGIDVPGITHVINFDLPNEAESYVHRIGRTARAGHSGVAISFCDVSERPHLAGIEQLIRRQIPVDTAHPFHSAIPFRRALPEDTSRTDAGKRRRGRRTSGSRPGQNRRSQRGAPGSRPKGKRKPSGPRR